MKNKKTMECSNCKELIAECACMRNICIKCKMPVGNITFTVCDDCWEANTIKSVCDKHDWQLISPTLSQCKKCGIVKQL